MKSLILIFALGFIVSDAFASKARLEALGEDQIGSMYIDDERNVFLNPAELNNHFDFVELNWGNTANLTDEEDKAKATGGAFKKYDNKVIGLYFGQDSNTASSLRSGPFAALTDADFGALQITAAEYAAFAGQVKNTNTLDLFYGREGAMKWGVKLNYSSSSNEQGATAIGGGAKAVGEHTQQGASVAIGAIRGDWELATTFGLVNKAEIKDITGFAGSAITDYEFKGAGGIQLNLVKRAGNGVSYFLQAKNINAEQDGLSDSIGFDDKWSIMEVMLGYGRVKKANDNLNLFYKGWVYMDDQKARAFVTDNDRKEQYLGLLVGMEADIKEWLRLRGSVQNKFLGTTENGDGDKQTISNAVDVKVGASLVFGDMSIDGLIGNDGNGDATTGDDLGVLRTDSLMSRVSMTYKF